VDFVAVVDQVIALLRQRGRVAYRTLKRQFQLDDEAIEDLKIELIDAQHLARDEQGSILVWLGDHGPQRHPPAMPEVALSQTASLSAAPSTPEAERRQLTVLFCDLVRSTALSTQLDPEDYREVVHAYHQRCAEVIQRFEGYVAQYLGDGVLVYFGYPTAHEDDARRAVQAGLALLETCATLATPPALPCGEPLAVRLGVHTGLVVVGDVGAGTHHEALALGETPNIAARLQHLAESNTLVLSAATQQLVAGYFRWKSLGLHRLHGLAQPMEVYRVLGPSGIRSRLEVAATHGLTPLVGRDQEVSLLQACWTRVVAGMGQVVLLEGEAGIGKSRLVQVLTEHVAEAGHAWLECQGSPYYQHTSLYPLTELLARRLLSLEPAATAAQHVQHLEAFLAQQGLAPAETVPLLAPLLALPLPDTYAPLQVAPEQQRQQTLHVLVRLVLGLAAAHPLLLVLEDLHWVDPSTLEWLSLLVDQGPTTRLLTLCTTRLDYTLAWTGHSHCTRVTLARLPQRQATALTHQVATGQDAAGRGGGTDCGQDRWRAAVCGRGHQDGAGIRPAPGAGRALCAGRLPASAGHPRHVARRAPGTVGSDGDGQESGATRGNAGARVFLHLAPGHDCRG